MKHLVLSIGLLLLAPSLFAQAPAVRPPVRGHVVSLGIFTLAPSIGVQVEQRLGQHFSLSLSGSRFFSSDYPGYQGVLAARFYFRPTAPTGLYLQAQAGAYSHTAQVVGDYPGVTHEPQPTSYNGKGGGLGLGYQWQFGQRWLANAGLGLRFYPHNLGAKCDCYYLGNWYAVGQPGSVLDGQLSVGYAF
ncbi:DUF3575 domain-containing protein [Hymenobacter sp. RP-2-7]|uniref:DUF3575 domain-containing protein n=1 Tax=Hymenobacter polaris TaxID=2682546 RepID=A0A7Y0FLY9_9BACT|nr:DUF3575 domain-containing protein [Hymenobacter polaris]NML65293.1 DUF3575 domain-containing protein [Hymenobacter polaris]